MRIRYAGDDHVAGSSDTASVRVVKARPTVTASHRPDTVKADRTRATVTIRVRAAGFTPAFVAAMPSKVYEYLACGLAVLSSPLPRVVELLDESGAGEVVSSADAAAAVLTRWAGDRAELARVQAGAAARGAVLRAAGNAYDGMARRVAELAAVSARGRRASGPRR